MDCGTGGIAKPPETTGGVATMYAGARPVYTMSPGGSEKEDALMTHTAETTVSHIDTSADPRVPPAQVKRLIDHIVNADRHFFTTHPDVTIRDRRYVPGEAWPHEPGDVNRVTVIRFSATRHARCYYRVDGNDV